MQSYSNFRKSTEVEDKLTVALQVHSPACSHTFLSKKLRDDELCVVMQISLGHRLLLTLHRLTAIPISNTVVNRNIIFWYYSRQKNNCVKRFQVTGFFQDTRRIRWRCVLIDLDESGAVFDTSPNNFGAMCTVKFLTALWLHGRTFCFCICTWQLLTNYDSNREVKQL